ncbi:MAG: hypothetical protein ABI809_11890, partial [Caldimonas sp.]
MRHREALLAGGQGLDHENTIAGVQRSIQVDTVVDHLLVDEHRDVFADRALVVEDIRGESRRRFESRFKHRAQRAGCDRLRREIDVAAQARREFHRGRGRGHQQRSAEALQRGLRDLFGAKRSSF